MSRLLTGFLVMVLTLSAKAEVIAIEQLSSLPQPVSNNAVALVVTDEGDYLFSFLGLGAGKTWQDISSDALVLNPGEESWVQLKPVAGESGRLAASAVSVAGAAWLFGGYTVAADGSEASTPDVYRIQPNDSGMTRVTDMPVPVEDSVIVVYQDRYIYLISGWHDLGNVNLVQVLDTQTMRWEQATPWPGTPVFGHSGGIVNDHMVACDGVRIQYPEDKRPRQFLSSDECWLGRIDADNYRRINWQKLPPHAGTARYRMAATGDSNGRVVFTGGSVNPYNFNGMGYNGVPAEPETSVFSLNVESGQWQQHGDLPHGTMDHRGLLFSSGWYYLVGGMHAGQSVTDKVYRFNISP